MYCLALPSAVREWTIVVPVRYTFVTFDLTLWHLWMQLVVARPFAGWLLLATLVRARFIKSRQRSTQCVDVQVERLCLSAHVFFRLLGNELL